MPNLSQDQIRAAITDGAVIAISIDTAVFDAKQKMFRNAVLRRLDQFHTRDVRVVITDVVAKEITAHLRDDALETQRALKKALRSHTIRWKREELKGEQDSLLISSDAVAFAEAEFDSFLGHVNGEVINVSDTLDVVEHILGRYFSRQPPFGAADKRKNEFPDAFALLRLESFAVDSGKLLVCVSPDKGWAEFASQSDHLVCVAKLEDVLALFNAADQHLADAIVKRWQESEGGEFIEKIANAFEYRLDDLDFDIDWDADFHSEAEPLSATLQYVSSETIGNPIVIGVDSGTVTFTVPVKALVGFEASFSFFAGGSIDRDQVELGLEEAYIEELLPFNLTITADRSLDNGPISHEVEVAKKKFVVNFGNVEAFPDEDPTHEKY